VNTDMPDNAAQGAVHHDARRLMKWAILALAVILTLASELSPFATGGDATRLVGLLLIMPALGLAWLLNERGHTGPAQLAVIYGCWAGVTFGLTLHGGLRAPLAVAYPIIVFAAGWLCKRKHLVAVATLCALSIAGLTAAEVLRWLPPHEAAPAAWIALVQATTLAATITAVLYFRRRYQQRYDTAQALATRLAASENELRLILDNAPAMVLRLDRACRVRLANAALAGYLGRPDDSIAGQPLRALFGQETGASLIQLAEKAAAQGSAQASGLKHRQEDGRVRTLEADAAAHASSNGDIDGTLLLIRDVSAQHEDRNIIEAQNRLHDALLRAQADAEIGLVVIEDERIVFANEVARRLFRYEEAGTGGAHQPVARFLQQVAPGDQERVATNLANRLLGKPFEPRFDIGLCRPDGRQQTLEITAAVMAAEPFPRTLVMLSDVTEQRQNAARLQRFNEELESQVATRTAELGAVNQDLEAFAYSVSHEMRTPLRAIDGYAHLLNTDHADRLSGEAAGYPRLIRQAAQRLDRLTDDMLELATVSRAALKPERVDLSGLAAEIIGGLRRAQPAHTVETRIQADCAARCDPAMARVLLRHLLDNAWKYSGNKEAPRIEFGREDGAFFVRDNGVGFDMQYAGKLFTPFQRMHRPSEFEGSGIGLATVARIVKRHGGTISASATPGQGATFRFTLPPASPAESLDRK
jgi:PAS domain S-box-containing protein